MPSDFDYTLPNGLRRIIFPFRPAPGGVEPRDYEPLVFTQIAPSAQWTILHNFGYDPNVSVIVGGEEADADVSYPSTTMVLVTFAQPQTGTARLT